jgi:fumarate hydratase subunit alpha
MSTYHGYTKRGAFMREIEAQAISDAVAKLCQDSCLFLPEDVERCIKKAEEHEESEAGKEALSLILENARVSREESIPLCQDCGVTVIFIEVGQDAHIVNGSLHDALAEGVSRGYKEGFLRKSMVSDPLFERKNTLDNTPPVTYIDIAPGDRIKITVAPKGGGSENMSALAMLTPSAGVKGVKDFVLHTVEKAGSNPCPPILVGVGIGGTADKAMILAKKAILRKLPSHNDAAAFSELEETLLAEINGLGIGPQGFGGRVTALAVNIETFPCHIASLPVAVNIQCHSARHKEVII